MERIRCLLAQLLRNRNKIAKSFDVEEEEKITQKKQNLRHFTDILSRDRVNVDDMRVEWGLRKAPRPKYLLHLSFR